jgi:hypothetical protein
MKIPMSEIMTASETSKQGVLIISKENYNSILRLSSDNTDSGETDVGGFPISGTFNFLQPVTVSDECGKEYRVCVGYWGPSSCENFLVFSRTADWYGWGKKTEHQWRVFGIGGLNVSM